MSLWFVTPAFRRYDLTAVCLEQRARVIRVLAEHGVEARCVVIADDENLDIARALGFDTVERNNDWLDTKFNDGIEYAGRQGAEWIVPIGSDSWITPEYFLPLPEPGVTRTAPEYCPVTRTRIAELQVGTRSGAGPYVFHRSLLEPSAFRPAGDGQRNRGIDGATIAGIEATQSINWQARTLHPFQYIGFRGATHITSYDKLWAKWGVREHADPWAILARFYPQDLVERARTVVPEEPPRLTDNRGLRRMGNTVVHAFRVSSDGSPDVALCGVHHQPYDRDHGPRALLTCGRCGRKARRIPQRLAA